MPLEVTLTNHELLMASSVGAMRQLSSLVSGRSPGYGCDGEQGWSIHIEGACGELAVAKVLGLFWDGSVNRFRGGGGDVGDLHVRTRSRHAYDLIVRPDDPDDAIFILVTGLAPRFLVHGQILGSDAKRAEWSQTYGGRPPAYFVPKRALTPLREETRAA